MIFRSSNRNLVAVKMTEKLANLLVNSYEKDVLVTATKRDAVCERDTKDIRKGYRISD